MMIKALTLVLFVCGILSLFGQSSKTLRTYGVVKKTETVIKYIDGEEVFRYIEEEEVYNREGDWIEKMTYGSNGDLKLHQKRIFEDGEVIDEIEIDADGSDIKDAKPPSYKRSLFTYRKGNMIEEKKLDQEGELVRQTEFKYNKLGDLVEVTVKNGDGTVSEIETMEYDKRGLKVLERKVNSKGMVKKEKIYTYE